MKTKFEEFIELSIPSIEQRESMRLWVKNALNGIKNNKALILYGVGPSGKSTLLSIIESIIGEGFGFINADYGYLNSMYTLDIVSRAGIIVFADFPRGNNSGRLKCLIENESMITKEIGKDSVRCSAWPNVIIHANRMPEDSILRRSIVIKMEYDESIHNDPNFLFDVLADKKSALDWFLK